MKLMQQFGLPPDEIYRRSFATVDALLPAGIWSPEERHIIRRIVHATGDPQLAPTVRLQAGCYQCWNCRIASSCLHLYRCPYGRSGHSEAVV